MKLKRQFFILSSLITSIPILCSVFIIIHTYIHSPNRYLMKGSDNYKNLELFSSDNMDTLEKSLKMLPKDVQALLCRTTDRKIIYSTIPEIEVGTTMQKAQLNSFAIETSDKYFYQFTRIPSASPDIFLVTRLSLEKINNEQKTKTYLKILLAIILITFTSLVLIFLISKDIFNGLKKIEQSSFQLAEGDLNKPITTENPSMYINEFSRIMISLEKMRRELMEMQTSKNHFITGISHDLRTPVSVIKGYSEAIMDEVITDKSEIKNTIELIESKATQLEAMIDTLINFVKLNNTEIKEKLVSQSITKLIQDFAKYIEITGKIFKRQIKTDIQIHKDISVPLNSQLVHRSFENLFSNAIRYTKENDLIEVTAFTVESENKNLIIMQLRDTGVGIDKKDLDYIFDIFYRGTNSRQEEGMGIGLAVVKSIMNTHGWDITVESQKKKGTCFTIKIPY